MNTRGLTHDKKKTPNIQRGRNMGAQLLKEVTNMPEKLEEFTLIKALLVPESLEKGTPEYEADREFQEWVIKTAAVVLQRYRKKHENEQWTKNRIKNANIGFSGQLAFERLLQYMKIPYETDVPTERERRPFDFKLSIGTIEIKSYDYYCAKTIIKESEWKGNDFLVVWQYTDNTYQRIRLRGWLTKTEVEEYPILLKGEVKELPFASGRVIPMKNLQRAETFYQKLLECHSFHKSRNSL
jgi:hypothetical protein